MVTAEPSPVPALLRTLVSDPGRPRLTWYGTDGERVELSGHVLDNWVTKTTNLLVEELGAEPGTRVLLDLPTHWRTVVWALAVWRSGATVVLPDDVPGDVPGDSHTRPTPDVVVTHRPGQWSGTRADLVAVALPALARRVDAPAGAVDANAAVMTYGDVLTSPAPAQAEGPALETDGRSVPYRELLRWAGAAGSALWPGAPAAVDGTLPGRRVLLEPSDPGPAPALGAVLAAYAADGSVVLCSPDAVRGMAKDPASRERLVAGERITAGA